MGGKATDEERATAANMGWSIRYLRERRAWAASLTPEEWYATRMLREIGVFNYRDGAVLYGTTRIRDIHDQLPMPITEYTDARALCRALDWAIYERQKAAEDGMG